MLYLDFWLKGYFAEVLEEVNWCLLINPALLQENLLQLFNNLKCLVKKRIYLFHAFWLLKHTSQQRFIDKGKILMSNTNQTFFLVFN